MQLRLDPDSPTPVFAQIVDGVVEGVRAGRLVPGERLPTVRGLAGDLGIASNTVAKAYRVLEEEGHVETRGRGGTVIAPRKDGGGPAEQVTREFVRTARNLGLDLEQTIGLVRRSW